MDLAQSGQSIHFDNGIINQTVVAEQHRMRQENTFRAQMKTCIFTDANRSEWQGADTSRIDDISGYGDIQVAVVDNDDNLDGR